MKKPPYTLQTLGGSYTQFDSWVGTTTALNQITASEDGVYQSIKTPGFRLLKKRNLPFNNFTHRYSNTVFPVGSELSVSNYGRYITTTGNFYSTLGAFYSIGFPLADTSTSDISARNKVLNRIRGSSVNLLQAFAERKQTVNMLAKTVNRLAAGAMAIRRGNLKHASVLFGISKSSGKSLQKEIPPSPKNLSNHWLEYSYGWRPLVNDIYDSCEVLADTYFRRKPTSVSASANHQHKENNLLVQAGSSYNELCNSTHTVSHRYYLEFIESESLLSAASKTGISNPALLAWELLPYSFVFDWIIPVGGYLKLIDATNGMSFVRGTSAVRVKSRHVTRMEGVSSADWTKTYTGLGRIHSLEYKSRSVLTSFPSPALQIPSFSLGTSQILSGLALLTQAFKR